MKAAIKGTLMPNRFQAAGILAAALICMAGLGGCAVVKPYEREVLADCFKELAAVAMTIPGVEISISTNRHELF